MLNEEAQVAAFLMVSLVLLDPVSTVEYVKGERIGTRLLQSSTKDRPVSPALWAQVFSDHDFKFATCTEMFCKLGTQSKWRHFSIVCENAECLCEINKGLLTAESTQTCSPLDSFQNWIYIEECALECKNVMWRNC